MSERTCLDCEYWNFYGGERGYSSLTPGSDMVIGCGRGHWRLINLEGGNEMSFRETVAMAAECKDFSPVPPPGAPK